MDFIHTCAGHPAHIAYVEVLANRHPWISSLAGFLCVDCRPEFLIDNDRDNDVQPSLRLISQVAPQAQ